MKSRILLIAVGAWTACALMGIGGGCAAPAAKKQPEGPNYGAMAPALRLLALETDGPESPGALEALHGLLGSTEPLYRAEAAQTLAVWASTGDIHLIVPAITSRDPLIRNVAQAAYIEHSPRGFGAMRVQKDVLVEVQPALLRALQELGDPQGISSAEKVLTPVQERLQRSLDGGQEEAVLAADVLANIGDAGARRVLIRLVESGEGAVLAKAARACVRDNMGLGPTLLPIAFGGGVAARRAVMQALVLEPDARLMGLALRGLDDADAGVRRNAIRALGNMSSAAAVEELTARLLGPAEEKEDIIRALGVIGLKGADTLRQYLKRGAGSERLEVTALLALAPYAGRDDIPWVSQRLKSPSKYVRAASLAVLGRIGNPEAQAAIMSCVKDPEPLVRASAAKALGQIGTLYACKELKSLLDDPSPIVASMAAWGLGKAASIDAVPALVKVAKTRPAGEAPALRVSELYGGPELVAVEALGRIGGPKAVEFLRECLGSGAWRMRATAAQALATAGDASEPVIQALESRLQDRVNLVRAQALVSLKALGKTYEADQLKSK
ncbi:MAG: HEAT repeat domain-containing protein [Planctomycetes bacterium]|nr:HEAT repeat domain-containing protein [Planctomycetota bacterium]